MKSKVAPLETEETGMVMNTRQRSGDCFKGSETYLGMLDLSVLSPT